MVYILIDIIFVKIDNVKKKKIFWNDICLYVFKFVICDVKILI